MSFSNQTQLKKCFKWKWPPMEPMIASLPKSKLKHRWPNQTLQMIQVKLTTNERRPPIMKVKYINISCWILSQFITWALVIKPNLTNVSNENDLQWKMTSNINSEIKDLHQIQNLCLSDQTKHYKFLKGRRSPMEIS